MIQLLLQTNQTCPSYHYASFAFLLWLLEELRKKTKMFLEKLRRRSASIWLKEKLCLKQRKTNEGMERKEGGMRIIVERKERGKGQKEERTERKGREMEEMGRMERKEEQQKKEWKEMEGKWKEGW